MPVRSHPLGAAVYSQQRVSFCGDVRASDETLDVFCRVVRPLRLREQALKRESNTLAGIRDTLLPKLISGELRVKEAERFAAEAAG